MEKRKARNLSFIDQTMKKADIDEQCDSKSARDCLVNKCSDYDTCDNCLRRVCKYVSVLVSDPINKEDEELWCRYCCRETRFSTSEIESGRVYL